MAEADPYDAAVAGLEGFGGALCHVIKQSLAAASIKFHSVDFRVKGRSSVVRKMAANPEHYGKPTDLGDLLGVRVITYFPDEVDAAAAVLEDEFSIDRANSVDKRALLDPDRFGYLSLHYAASLDQRRGGLAEYATFDRRPFELQIRSILQHAWAEMEHDVGYKSEEALPRDLRRRFSRLAGLLEIADDEFTALRRELQEYGSTVAQDISDSPGAVDINQDSITGFIQTSEDVSALDAFICGLTTGDSMGGLSPEYAARRALGLQILGVANIAELQVHLTKNAEPIKAFAASWITRNDDRTGPLSCPKGVSLFYLEYLVAAQAPWDLARRWLAAIQLHEDLIVEVREVYRAITPLAE